MSDTSFSVIMPVLNESDTIERCIDSLLSSACDKEKLEIIVVDGLSDDGTREIVRQYQQSTNVVQLIDNEEKTTPSGFNKGFDRVSNDVIVLMSGHAYVAKNFFETITELLESQEIDADVVGPYVEPRPDGYRQAAIAGALTTRVGAASNRFRPYEGYVDTVAYGAYRQHVIEAVGKMDTELPRGQDYDYNKRVRESGFQIYQSSSTAVFYEPRKTLTSTFKQKFGNGGGKARIYRDNNIVEFVDNHNTFFKTLTPLLLLSVIMLPGVLLITSLLFLLYLITLLTLSIESIQEKSWLSLYHSPAMIFALLTIHFGYALGFIFKVLSD